MLLVGVSGAKIESKQSIISQAYERAPRRAIDQRELVPAVSGRTTDS